MERDVGEMFTGRHLKKKVGRNVVYWLLSEPPVRYFLHRMRLCKSAEAVTWFNGNWWALWNDIYRCPREIRSDLSQSQLAGRRDSISHKKVMDQYGRLHLISPASVCLRLSLSHRRSFGPFREKERHIYFYENKCYSFIP